MLSLTPAVPAAQPLTVLCIGAHADDIEIGCGGTMLRLLSERPAVTVHWLVLSADAVREQEARRSAERILRRACARHIRVERFRDSFMPWQGRKVKALFEELKRTVDPDLIFAHSRSDAHQDHRLAAELTWNTFRNHAILEYEVPKYDGDLGQPNLFVPLSARTRRTKLKLLMTSFPSQHAKAWFTESTFDALMRIRGVECAAADGYAEAFHVRKLVLTPAAGLV